MSANPALLVSLAILGAIIVVVLVLYRPRDRSSEWRDGLNALAARVEASSREDNERVYRLQQLLLDHERARKSEHGVLARDLERRLAETASAQATATGQLNAALNQSFGALKEEVLQHLGNGRTHMVRSLAELKEQTTANLGEHRATFEQRQGEALKSLTEALRKGMETTQRQVSEALVHLQRPGVGRRVAHVLTYSSRGPTRRDRVVIYRYKK